MSVTSTAQPYIASDPKQVKKRAESAKDAKAQETRELQALLKLPEFRRYVWRHMHESCGLMRSPANPNGSVQSTNIGMQDVARILWAEIDSADPQAIVTMMREYREQSED